jgi:hypothetical protein
MHISLFSSYTNVISLFIESSQSLPIKYLSFSFVLVFLDSLVFCQFKLLHAMEEEMCWRYHFLLLLPFLCVRLEC